MAEVKAPHYKLQHTARFLAGLNKKIFWGIAIISIAREIIRRYVDLPYVSDVVAVLGLVAILIYFVIDAVVNYGLNTEVENVKTDDLLDNSFGSSFCMQKSDGYFDNDDLPHGLYKASVNMFEKCFFTYSLVKATIVKKIIVPAVMLIILLVLAYYGFRDSAFPAVPLLQALLSATLLGSLVKQFILMMRLSAVNEGWHSVFRQKDVTADFEKYIPLVYRYWLQYEKLLSKMPPGIGQKDYEKYCSELNEQWAAIRNKYSIGKP